jgi:nanoRNase/pAp phosphatase (c-di-AMP/oligoRNAs hydrolase)|tara:strand:- start:12951 stop:13244 length:294 start_codon:yes stop_codon:yes gene_type:complete
MYNLTNSLDDVERINFTVPVRCDLDALATYITVALISRENSNPNSITSKQSAIEIARSTVLYYGEDQPFYRIGDEHLDDEKAAVLVRLNELWRVGGE